MIEDAIHSHEGRGGAAGRRDPRPSAAGQVVIVIPAYQPPPTLPKLVCDLAAAPVVAAVVVVNDGSGPEHLDLFAALRRIERATVLTHVVNLGKGAALKTGMNHAARAFPACAGVVTVDADGQHALADILRTVSTLIEHPRHVILGSRRFDTEVPLRSRFGNVMTRHIMHALTGQKLADTQTGLRALPMDFVPELLCSKTTRYDFELEMLIACRQSARPITEVPIATIYVDGNRSSHFNPLLDSMKIYFVFLRFSAVSLLTAGIDNLVFVPAFLLSQHVGAAMGCGRLVAGLFNYFANKLATFRVRVPNKTAMPRFYLLMLLSGLASYGLIMWFVTALGFLVIIAKLTAETIMFVFNFWVQRDFVFRPRRGMRS